MSAIFTALFLAFIITHFYLKIENKCLKIISSICITLGLGFLFGHANGVLIATFVLLFQILLQYFILKNEDDTKRRKLSIKRRNLLLSISLNIVVILTTIAIFSYFEFEAPMLLIVYELFDNIALSASTVLSIITALLFLHIPCNEIIQAITSTYKLDIKKEEELVNSLEIEKDEEGELSIVINEELKEVSDNNLGRLIGTIERIILVVLIMNGLYSLAGLVLTAKSIARYNKISTDKIFAEVYLLGTLLSLLLVVITYYFLF